MTHECPTGHDPKPKIAMSAFGELEFAPMIGQAAHALDDSVKNPTTNTLNRETPRRSGVPSLILASGRATTPLETRAAPRVRSESIPIPHALA